MTSMAFETDASKVHGIVYSEENPDNILFCRNFSDKCSSMISQLSVEELKSMMFLLIDFYSSDIHMIARADMYVKWIRNSNEALKAHLIEFCREPKVTCELLGTIQNFKLLKEFGMCRHIFQRQCDNFSTIRPIWKLLYSICKEIDEKELQMLNNLFFGEMNKATCCEELVCMLFLQQKISENNLSEFARVLKCINRLELSEKITTFSGTSNSPGLYYIPNPTVEKPCGLSIIINQEKFEYSSLQHDTLSERRGSAFDRDQLRDMWQNFGFNVEVYNDLTAGEIMSLFVGITKRKSFDCHAFVACILSHGDRGSIYGSDSVLVTIHDLVDIVANKCPYLNDKPKFFLIQACQGQKLQRGAIDDVSVSAKCDFTYETDANCSHNTPYYSDVYIAVATVPGYVSYRHPETGSLFVTEIVQQLKLYGDKEDIECIMKRVKDIISKNQTCIQMPITESTLRRKLIFKQMGQ